MEWNAITLDPVIHWIIRLALAALFGFSASHKMRDLQSFRAALKNYKILPEVLVIPASLGLIALELSLMLGLLIPADGFPAGIYASLLLSLYSLAIGINLLRGRREIDCGCLGPAAHQPLSVWLLARNGLLILGALATALPDSGRTFVWLDVFSLLGGAILLALIASTVNLLTSEPSHRLNQESHS